MTGRLRGVAAAVLALQAGPLSARVLEAGPGQAHAGLAAAVRAAEPGDVVRLAPGTYYECAVVHRDGLVIEGAGPDQTVLSDAACQGKASLVISARDVTVRGLTLARVRVPDGNGAGIRAEGANLLLERVRFENNQNGVLAAASFRGTLRVRDCAFAGNGVPDAERPTGALVVPGADLLEVEDSVFDPGRGGAAIVSAAGLTRVRGGRLMRSATPGGATVQVSGGLVLEGATLQAGAGPGRQEAAVLALPAAEDAPLVLRGNRLRGAGVLLLDWSGREAELAGNSLDPGAGEASTAGAWGYRARSAAREAYGTVRHLAGAARRQAAELLRR